MSQLSCSVFGLALTAYAGMGEVRRSTDGRDDSQNLDRSRPRIGTSEQSQSTDLGAKQGGEPT